MPWRIYNSTKKFYWMLDLFEDIFWVILYIYSSSWFLPTNTIYNWIKIVPLMGNTRQKKKNFLNWSKDIDTSVLPLFGNRQNSSAFILYSGRHARLITSIALFFFSYRDRAKIQYFTSQRDSSRKRERESKLRRSTCVRVCKLSSAGGDLFVPP